MAIETVADVVEWIADLQGIYNCPDRCYLTHDNGQEHPENCWCRQCFRIAVMARLDRAIANEAKLRQAGVIF